GRGAARGRGAGRRPRRHRGRVPVATRRGAGDGRGRGRLRVGRLAAGGVRTRRVVVTGWSQGDHIGTDSRPAVRVQPLSRAIISSWLGSLESMASRSRSASVTSAGLPSLSVAGTK